jgi:hypothetical protein
LEFSLLYSNIAPLLKKAKISHTQLFHFSLKNVSPTANSQFASANQTGPEGFEPSVSGSEGRRLNPD